MEWLKRFLESLPDDGCDPVELLFDLEESFGVQIPDEKAEKINSVADLYVYLLAQKCRNTEVPCPTSRAFYKIRKALTDYGADRRQVRPMTRLRGLLPAADRATALARLATELGLSDVPDPQPEPAPRFPVTKAFWCGVATCTIAAGLGWLTLQVGHRGPTTLAFLLILLCTCAIAEICCLVFGIWSMSYRRAHPLPTVRDLMLRLTAQCHERIGDDVPAAVWSKLVTILAKHLGWPVDQIHPERRFVE